MAPESWPPNKKSAASQIALLQCSRLGAPQAWRPEGSEAHWKDVLVGLVACRVDFKHARRSEKSAELSLGGGHFMFLWFLGGGGGHTPNVSG